MDIFPEGSFQIILQSDVDYTSENWQRQCKNLYEDLYRALPEGYIKPSKREGSRGERSFDTILFSTITVSEVAAKFTASIIFEALNNWSENTQDSCIKVKYPDGNIITLPKQSLSKIYKCSIVNPNLSMYEILNRVINLAE